MIQIKQKNSWQATLDVIDAAGDPLDVSTASVNFYLWRIGDAAAALALTEADAAVTPGADGTVTVELTPTQCELALGKYRMELRVGITLATVPYAVSQDQVVEVVDSLDYQGPGQ